MKAKLNSLGKNLLTVLFLCFLLWAVIYAMRYTRGDSFQDTLGILFNPSSEKVWNWCPNEVKEINFIDNRLVTEAEITQICTVEVEPAPEIAGREYTPLLRAYHQNGFVVLESNAQLDVFRVEGLPFRSKKLSEFLKSKLKEF